MLKVLQSATSSLLGCTVFFGFVFAIPEWFYFANDLHAKGQLTVVSALVLAIGGFLIGAVCGALGWFTVFKALKERNGADQNR